MSKNNRPYFEFIIERDGPSISFVFYPGNIAEHNFKELVDLLIDQFRKAYGQSYKQYINPTTKEIDRFGVKKQINTVAVADKKILAVLEVLMQKSRPSSPYNIHLTGQDNQGNEKTILIENYMDVLTKAKEVVPMYNKNNNTLTTKRAS